MLYMNDDNILDFRRPICKLFLYKKWRYLYDNLCENFNNRRPVRPINLGRVNVESWGQISRILSFMEGYNFLIFLPYDLAGAGLSFLAGGVFGWTFGQEIANHWMQLYRLDTMAAQVKFMEWWENKCDGRS